MKTYIVGITELFINTAKLVKVEAETEIEAVGKAILASTEDPSVKDDYQQWWDSIDKTSMEHIQEELANGEMLVTDPMEI